ncbi:DUF4167 domain-containing protein [Gemmobacter sp. 24YEA27]|uniref:DUF4167 domain-containing protein n=1 Tax=Gemmobacter sp. 24YEA27 TaxID=3040672 RepID=UPI0024B36914|nr:DUF4167 domain-containing protein [Gemmobacter sp. 24YEA27]
MRSSKKRSRSNQNRPRSLGNIVNRVFDSSGPEGKVRGTPQQIIEKYQTLARDAQLSNDRVAAENFLQHAEHYTRMLAEAQRELAVEQEARQQQYQQTGTGQSSGNQSSGNQNGGQYGNQNGGNRDNRERGERDNRNDRGDRFERNDGRNDSRNEVRSDGRNDNRGTTGVKVATRAGMRPALKCATRTGTTRAMSRAAKAAARDGSRAISVRTPASRI